MNAPETVFSFNPMETDKTGETDLVSNGEFLRTVFGDNLADMRPILVSFAGNPASVPGKRWFGRQYRSNTAFTGRCQQLFQSGGI